MGEGEACSVYVPAPSGTGWRWDGHSVWRPVRPGRAPWEGEWRNPHLQTETRGSERPPRLIQSPGAGSGEDGVGPPGMSDSKDSRFKIHLKMDF